MSSVLSFLSDINNNFRGIIIYDPKNDVNKLQKLSQKYTSSLNNINFTMDIERSQNVVRGECLAVKIQKRV